MALYTPGSNYWIPHDEFAWLNGKCVSCDPEKSQFDTEDAGRVTVPTVSKTGPYSLVDKVHLEGVSDIASLTNATEASMLSTVKTRYLQKDIYTYVGRILIAVNPFQALPITGKTWVDKYRHTSTKEPHIYAIGQTAYKAVCEGDGNQAIMIAGESGAGKTEAAKLVFNYLSISGAGSGIETRVMQVNPILEAFGNAKTVRNHNSSRFGKWTEIAMNTASKIESAKIIDYVLELTRVTGQTAGERGYHIFYLLIACVAEKYGLSTNPADYRYLCGGGAIPDYNERDEFTEFSRACSDMGMKSEEVDDMLTVVAAILHLGNVEYNEMEEDNMIICKIRDMAPVEAAAKVLGLKPADVSKFGSVLTTKEIKIGSEVTKKNLSMAESTAARDSCAKFLYNRTFKWLVARLNKSLQESAPYDESMDFIGVLDIAGFETFEVNSLEQLFINLSNEKLQQIFNERVFKDEMNDYAEEGISIKDFTFKDNQPIVDMIEGPGGLLGLLDESIKVPSPSDVKFLNRANQELRTQPTFIKNKFNKPFFQIQHYAGNVEYAVAGFQAKNQEYAPQVDFFYDSSVELMKTFDFTLDKKTVAHKFKMSLKSLMTKIKSAAPHFVRCIKPNQDKKPMLFQAPSCIEQLKNAGVMEAIRIRQMGYPLRFTFKEFMDRFIIIFHTKYRVEMRRNFAENPKKVLEDCMIELQKVHDLEWENLYSVGHRKIMFKVQVEEKIMELRNAAYEEPARLVQRLLRGYFARKRTKLMKQCMMDTIRFLKEHRLAENRSFYDHCGEEGMNALTKRIVDIMQRCEAIEFDHFLVRELGKLEEKMNAEVELLEHMKFYEESRNIDKITAILEQAHQLGMRGGLVADLEERLMDLEEEKREAEEAGIDFDEGADEDIPTIERKKTRLELKAEKEEEEEDVFGFMKRDGRVRAVTNKDFINRVKARARRPNRDAIKVETQWDQDLKDALETSDQAVLEKMCKEADQWKLESALVMQSKEELRNLESKAYIKLSIARLITKTDQDRISIIQLRNLRKLAERLNIPNAQVDPLNYVVSRRKRFSLTNGDDLQLLEGNRIDQCSLVVPAHQRKGLKHSRVALKGPLTKVSGSASSAAVQMFYNVMTYMKDYPMLGRTLDLLSEIRFQVNEKPELKDEIYVQIVKQLIGNRCPDSTRRGYDLLHRYHIHFKPSEELAPYLESYLAKAAELDAKDKEEKRKREQIQRDIAKAKREREKDAQRIAREREEEVARREREAGDELEMLKARGDILDEEEDDLMQAITKSAIERLREVQSNLIEKKRLDAIDTRRKQEAEQRERSKQILIFSICLVFMLLGLGLLPNHLWTPALILIATVIIAASFLMF